MSETNHIESYFSSAQKLTDEAVAWLSAHISKVIEARGHANVFLSGGSSPRPVYEALSEVELDWSAVTISLVDERWVGEDSPGSNAAFMKRYMLQNKAAAASFVPLVNAAKTASSGLAEIEASIEAAATPIDICVMGMGLDAHTASWFPDSEGLNHALDHNNKDLLSVIDATGCPVAGDYPERISLTLPAVLSAKHILLLLPSAEKLSVFEAAKSKDNTDAPVAALLDGGDRLTVFGLNA